jgi:hypothetical protein
VAGGSERGGGMELGGTSCGWVIYCWIEING